MATFTGSGLYVKIQAGHLKFGNSSNGTDTDYTNACAATQTVNGVTYRGFEDSTIRYLSLPTIKELSIAGQKTFTGTVKMYTLFSSPYDYLIWDSSWNTNSVQRKYREVRFVQGVLVSI